MLVPVILFLSLLSVHSSCPSSYNAPYDLSKTPTIIGDSVVFGGSHYYIAPCGTVDASFCPLTAGAQQCFATTTWELVADDLGSPQNSQWSALDGDWSAGAVSINTDIQTDYDQCIANPEKNNMKITFKCINGADTMRAITEPDAGKNGDCVFEFEVDSKVICDHTGGGGGGGGSSSKKGVSGGWIFVIILVVVFFVYLVGGMMFNRFRLGKSGSEMIPNRDFWTNLPGLVKDGCSFFVQKCRGLCGGSAAPLSSM